MRSDIVRQIYGMTFVLVLLVALALWQFEFVRSAIEANIFLNSTIIGVFLLGCFLVYRNAFGLFNEVMAMQAVRSDYASNKLEEDTVFEQPAKVYQAPVISGHAFSLLHEEIQSTGHLTIGTATMQNLVDGVEVKIEDQKSLAQYITGILVLLGLIGTFVGLMQTVTSVGDIIGNLSFGPDTDVNETVQGLITSLKGPLIGMGTGFSSSLFGLVTSLALGLMTRFAAAAANGFKMSFESWLVSVAKLESVFEDAGSGAQNLKEAGPANNNDQSWAEALSRDVTKMVLRIEGLVHCIESTTSEKASSQAVPSVDNSRDRRINKADRMVIAELQRLNDSVTTDTEWRRKLEQNLRKLASSADLDREMMREAFDTVGQSQRAESTSRVGSMATIEQGAIQRPSGLRSFVGSLFHRGTESLPVQPNRLFASHDQRLIVDQFKRFEKLFRERTLTDREDAAYTHKLLSDVERAAKSILHQMEKQEAVNREFMFILTELRRDRRDQREERRTMRQNILATERTMWQISDQIKENAERLEMIDHD